MPESSTLKVFSENISENLERLKYLCIKAWFIAIEKEWKFKFMKLFIKNAFVFFAFPIFCSSFGFSLLLFSSIVNADKLVELPPIKSHDVSLQIRAIAGMANYEYKDIFLPFEDVSDNIFFGGFGTRFNYDHFFADIYYQDSSIAYEHTLIGASNHPSVNLSRRDWAITTGYTFLENTFLGDVSAFGGYKSGQTSLNTIQTIFLSATEAPTFIVNESEVHFDAKDFFLGFANSWRIKGGRLGFNAAASLSFRGDYTFKSNTQVSPGSSIETYGAEAVLDPTTTFKKFGLNWIYPISDEFAYTISLEYYNYRMEGTTEGVSFAVDEQLYGVKASLVYSFNL